MNGFRGWVRERGFTASEDTRTITSRSPGFGLVALSDKTNAPPVPPLSPIFEPSEFRAKLKGRR